MSGAVRVLPAILLLVVAPIVWPTAGQATGPDTIHVVPPTSEAGHAAADTLESRRLIFHQLLHPVGEETYTLRELELYVHGGMSPLEAIQAATIVPARAMGLEHEAGTVEVGKRADLLVIEGDPLCSIGEIRHVHAVVANGRMYEAAALWRTAGFDPMITDGNT